jgi:hypothetical protein
MRLCSAAGPTGARWGDDDQIVYGTYLEVERVTEGVDACGDLLFEWWLGAAAGGRWQVQVSVLSERQVPLERQDATCLRTRQVDFASQEVSEDLTATTGTGDEHVQPSFASIAIQGAEIVREVAGFILAVANTDKDDVPFVALYIFKVLDEERLLGVGDEEVFKARISPPHQFNVVQQFLCLRLTECCDSKS